MSQLRLGLAPYTDGGALAPSVHPSGGMVAALYVDGRGIYAEMPDVDVWDESRDARAYAGPWPVVAHPPCARWCLLARFVEARYGYRVGDDGGTFAAALASVRRWGGVLEHPAHSLAWRAHGLATPARAGWSLPDAYGGRVANVWQHHYGHPTPKRTWLYAVSDACGPLSAGSVKSTGAMISSGTRTKAYARMSGVVSRQVSDREASATPRAFAAVLLAIARGARRDDR